MERWSIVLSLCALAGVCAPLESAVVAPDMGLLQEQNRIKAESEARIQKDILDPMLGANMAKVFVDVEIKQLVASSEESTRSGMGLAEKYKEKQGMQQHGGMATVELLPGIYRPKTLSGANDKPENAQAQQASQVKGIQELNYRLRPDFEKMTVSVLHDSSILDAQKDATRRKILTGLIVEAMGQYHLKEEDVFFRPAPWFKGKSDWREDLKKPEVYLPLLYALLFLLFLLFLFGPLWRFFVQYVKALRERPAAEVNVESKIEQPDDAGKGDEESIQKQEGKFDLTWTKKPDEPLPPPPPPPPPAPEEEDLDMQKFEPFSYINEENVKRLANLFILRKEEPWLIAMVASYLRPDFMRQLIAALPITMQAKVAVEALTLRQLTREQILSIDADIKENLDFVVGGMERILAILDDADTATRNNILNQLKNDKPTVYEAVRRRLLVFEDVASFPDREMQTVVRELKADNMARALQGASPEIRQKFLNNMSKGAASLLEENIEYASGLSQSQIDEERAKIMDVIKILEKEGKISVRQSQDTGYDGLDMQEELSAQEKREQRFAEVKRKTAGYAPAAAAPEPAPAPPLDPAQAQRYYEEGCNKYNSGDADGSIAYFDYATKLNPEHAQAFQYLGSIYYQAGRVSEAIKAFEKAFALTKDPQLGASLEGLKAQAGR